MPPKRLRLARVMALAVALPLMGLVLFGIYLQYHALQVNARNRFVSVLG